jgi:hypothetical protein
MAVIVGHSKVMAGDGHGTGFASIVIHSLDRMHKFITLLIGSPVHIAKQTLRVGLGGLLIFHGFFSYIHNIGDFL